MPKMVIQAAKRFGLTGRETEVFFLVLRGRTWKFIAGELNISSHTVDFHIRNILQKTGTHSCSEFYSIAYGIS